uniref:Uncharacterized protein n=1 Tax=Lynx canadensis TaxID=61383 RepID=A0A667GJN8_LYNCA
MKERDAAPAERGKPATYTGDRRRRWRPRPTRSGSGSPPCLPTCSPCRLAAIVLAATTASSGSRWAPGPRGEPPARPPAAPTPPARPGLRGRRPGPNATWSSRREAPRDVAPRCRRRGPCLRSPLQTSPPGRAAERPRGPEEDEEEAAAAPGGPASRSQAKGPRFAGGLGVWSSQDRAAPGL